MKLTKAQRKFLEGIKPHVDYRVVGKFSATAKRLEQRGYVNLTNGGHFAYITEAGRKALEGGE